MCRVARRPWPQSLPAKAHRAAPLRATTLAEACAADPRSGLVGDWSGPPAFSWSLPPGVLAGWIDDMRIGILGGKGVAGSAAAAELAARGHDVVVLSRRTGFDVTAPSASAAALQGLDALVDCLNPSKTTEAASRALLVDGLRATLEAAASHGVRQVVSLSIVGIDDVPIGYYRVKLEQEALVQSAPIPGTVVRATQFPELFDLAWGATKRLGLIPAPRGPIAPIAPRDVAAVIAEVVEAGPDAAAARVQIRGAEIVDLREYARRWKQTHGSRRPVLPLPALGGTLRAIARGDLVDASIPTPSAVPAAPAVGS